MAVPPAGAQHAQLAALPSRQAPAEAQQAQRTALAQHAGAGALPSRQPPAEAAPSLQPLAGAQHAQQAALPY